MRKLLLATVSATFVLVASPARADISFGELSDALDHAVDSLIEALFHLLLDPREVPGVIMPVPLPEPIIAGHVFDLPVSVNEMMEYDQVRIEDRTLRVDQLNLIAEEANAASTNNAEALAALAAMNAVPPVSVASQIAIGNQATIAMGDAFQTMEQIWVAHIATQADERQLQENVRALSQYQDAYFAGLDEIAGGVQPVGEVVDMPW